MDEEEIQGLEQETPDVDETPEELPEETPEETEEEFGEENAEDENYIPQSRFSEVVKERNSEREAREKMEKELEFYKNFIQANQGQTPTQTPKGNDVPELDYNQYMNDEGELDLNRYSRDLADAIRNGVKSEIKQELEYDRMANREWDDAVKLYPEVAENPTLERIVKSIKTQSLIDGKYVTYKEIADNVFAEFGKVRKAGAESVMRSEKIQSGAGLANMSNATPKQSKGTLTNADVARMSMQEYQKAQENGDIERAVKAGTLKGFTIR